MLPRCPSGSPYGILILTVLLVAGYLAASCTSTRLYRVRYDPSGDRSTFESARTVMGSPSMSAGLAGNQRIMWQASGSCSGEDCRPQQVEIIFYNGGTGELNVDSRAVKLIFDGRSRAWEDYGRAEEPARYSVPRGEFARVSQTGEEFARMAEAARMEVVFGITGTTSIRVPSERREAFRAMAREIGDSAGN